MDVEVVIYCAGKGNRLARGLPKALMPLAGRLLIDRQLEALRAVLPDSRICVMGGFRCADLQDHLRGVPGVRVVHNPFYELGGINGTAWLSRREVTCANVLRVHGDVLFADSALRWLDAAEATTVLVTGGRARKQALVAFPDGPRVEAIGFAADYAGPCEWAGIELYTRDEYRQIAELAAQYVDPRWYLFDVLNEFYATRTRPLWNSEPDVLEIDTPDDFRDAELLLRGKGDGE